MVNVNNETVKSERSIESSVIEWKDRVDTSFNSAIYCSAVKKERLDFLNAFSIEQVWAEMEKIKENKAKVDMLFRKTVNYQI